MLCEHLTDPVPPLPPASYPVATTHPPPQQREGAAYGTTGVTDSAYGTTGMATTTTEEVPVAVGVAEVPVVVTEQQQHTEVAAATVGEEVCGQKTFTEVRCPT